MSVGGEPAETHEKHQALPTPLGKSSPFSRLSSLSQRRRREAIALTMRATSSTGHVPIISILSDRFVSERIRRSSWRHVLSRADHFRRHTLSQKEIPFVRVMQFSAIQTMRRTTSSRDYGLEFAMFCNRPESSDDAAPEEVAIRAGRPVFVARIISMPRAILQLVLAAKGRRDEFEDGGSSIAGRII